MKGSKCKTGGGAFDSLILSITHLELRLMVRKQSHISKSVEESVSVVWNNG